MLHAKEGGLRGIHIYHYRLNCITAMHTIYELTSNTLTNECGPLIL